MFDLEMRKLEVKVLRDGQTINQWLSCTGFSLSTAKKNQRYLFQIFLIPCSNCKNLPDYGKSIKPPTPPSLAKKFFSHANKILER